MSRTETLIDVGPPYGTILFDCDSTLSRIEGIEELVRGNEEIARLTRAAMDGQVPLEEVYGRRLALARPTSNDLQRVGQLYIERALPHARALVEALRYLGKRVGIVSGGLLPAVRHFGLWLGIDARDVEAVDVWFDERGAYSGFDEHSPLAKSGGKADIVALFGAETHAGAVVLVGDGATDLEAAPHCARFIAFGGVERRERVFAAARVACDAPDLAALVPLLLSGDEMARLIEHPQHQNLLRAALEAQRTIARPADA